MKKLSISLLSVFFICSLLISATLKAQDPQPYTEGSVWSLTFVKLKANMGDDYLKGLSKTWKASMDELVKQKLIKSYKILLGEAANDDDFDLVLMTEVENFASYDPDPVKDAKRDEIEKKVKDALGGEEFQKTVSNYTTLREITGRKTMREIFLK